MSDVTTLILRFRDLVTERGETIRRHMSISASRGHVWWGWWHKLGETIPDETFRELDASAIAQGFNLYLMDSGQELLHRATCTALHWDRNRNEISCPDPDATPEYYNKKKYLAWFNLSNFTEVSDPQSVLQTLSYVRVDEFFASRQSRYKPFYNKQVSSLNELQQQNRTIWFVRPFFGGDRTHEISLLDPRSITPEHFSPDYFESAGRSLLWLSDLHFSADGHHAFPLESDGIEFDLGHQVEFAVKSRTSGPIAGVIISGDISWKALPEEFEQAKSFIKVGLKWTTLQSDQIAVSPGNHDFRFSTDPSEKDKPVTILTDDSLAAYSEFYQDLFYIAPNRFLSCGRRFLLGKTMPVDIVCLNSSWLQQREQAFQGHGFIGQDQMRDAAKQMGWTENLDENRAFRIVVLHHHIMPTTFSERAVSNYAYSVVLDAEALARWIVECRIDLVLHGHMHQPFCAKVSRPIDLKGDEQKWHNFYVVGMGSSGVEQSHLGEVGKNTIGLITFQRNSVKVSVLSVHKVNPSEEIWTVDLAIKG